MNRHPTITWKTPSSSEGHHPVKSPRERRSESRTKVSLGKELKAHVRCSKGQLWPALALNLSTQGALLQFLGREVPPLRVNEKVSVKFHGEDDVVWIAGIIRHRYANRIGMCFQTAMTPNAKMIKRLLSREVRIVDQGGVGQRAL